MILDDADIFCQLPPTIRRASDQKHRPFGLHHLRTCPFNSPSSTTTNTFFFVGRAGARSLKLREPLCHLLLLSVQYIDTCEGRRGLSNWSGILVYPIRLPPPNVGPRPTRICFPWMPFHKGSMRKQLGASSTLGISEYDTLLESNTPGEPIRQSSSTGAMSLGETFHFSPSGSSDRTSGPSGIGVR